MNFDLGHYISLEISRWNLESCISGMDKLIGVKWKGSNLVGSWANTMTLTFDDTHGLDHRFSRSNFGIVLSEEWEGRLTLNKWDFSQSFLIKTMTFWWQRLGVWSYPIVSRVTSNVGMPGPCLIIYVLNFLEGMSPPHIDMTQVLKILPQVRPGPTYAA